MRRRVKKWMALFLSLVVLSGCLTTYDVQAEDVTDIYPIKFYCPGSGTYYAYTLESVLGRAQRTAGVEIWVRKDWKLEMPDTQLYRVLPETATITVNSGATMTIGDCEFEMNGVLNILGTLDLEHSEGVLCGNGKINVDSGGRYLKRSYKIQEKGEVCLEAKDISYGQKLSEALITTDKVNYITPIEGIWRFCDGNIVPQAGTRCHDVIFEPKYPRTYDAKVFKKGGQVTTKQAVPKLTQYEKPQIHVGENLLEIKPEMTFISPVTGEEIEGEFSFEESERLQSAFGEQEVKGTFVPKDANYSSVTQYFKVDVLETVPTIMEVPVIRNQGTYGQTLGDIQYLQGKCTNPYTGKTVDGSWEWSDPGERLVLGNKPYKMLFIPEDGGYRNIEIDVYVNTLPKMIDSITWPACTDIVYGQSLSDSTLSFTKNEYGTFAWKNENIRPSVKNQGVEVVFIPANTDVYDWSRLAGYDEMTKTVTFTIPIQVHSVKGELPTIQATEIQEGACVSGSSLSLQGMEGKLEWKEPEQVAEKSGWYEVYYTPLDASNYDWSSYSPEEDGRIVMKVYLNVIPKPIEEIPTPSPTATTEVAPAPTQSPTAAAGVTSASSGQMATNNNSTTVDKQPSANTDMSTSSVDSSYIITQLITRASTITGPVVVKKTAIKKVKRKGKKARLSWKKVAGAKYQVQYSTSKRLTKKKKLSVNKTSITLTDLKKGKIYYARVRAWKRKNGKRVYGKWSKVKIIRKK